MTLQVKPNEPTRIFREEPLTTVYRRWMCGQDSCAGEMKPTGIAFPTNPMLYAHECSACGRRENASTMYPRVAHLPIEALETGPVPNGKLGGET